MSQRFLCVVEGCERHAQESAYCLGHDPARFHRIFLPSAPLIEMVEVRGGAAACGAIPHSARYQAYMRAKATGRIQDLTADRLALALLRRHPCEVWGELWWNSALTSHGCSSIYPQDWSTRIGQSSETLRAS